MYGYTAKKARRDAECRRMRQGKERKRLKEGVEVGLRPATFAPPKLRRVVIVIDYDMGFKLDIFRLFRRNRIDSYSVTHNTKPVDPAGWSNFCKRLSNHYPRLLSPYSE